ncbi:MAG: ferritin-like domain-containing protein [Anaerovoracaceae bacterium]|jgi:rubrerythrin
MNILSVAIAMEADLEKYYLKQAEINHDNYLNKIFTMLANDEKEHANILKRKSEELNYELKDGKTFKESKLLFKGMDDFKMETKAIPSQLDSIRFAQEMEKKSIDAYTEMKEEAKDERAKELFEFLLKEEEMHYEILDQLARHLSRPEEWVEDAEFGVREEY